MLRAWRKQAEVGSPSRYTWASFNVSKRSTVRHSWEHEDVESREGLQGIKAGFALYAA